MQRIDVRRGLGALLLAAILGFPGLAAAEPAGPARFLSADELFPALPGWDFLVGLLLEDGTLPPDDPTTGGGAMDPNGGPKPKPGPNP